MSLAEYREAEALWLKEIELEFGEGQTEYQYKIEGQGKPGTPLRRTYLAARIAGCQYELDMLDNKPFRVSIEQSRVTLRQRIAELNVELGAENAGAS